MTVRIHITVVDRRDNSVAVSAEAAFSTRSCFTDAIDFAHKAAADVPRADRHVSVHRV